MIFYLLFFCFVLYLYFYGGRNSSKWILLILFLIILFRSEFTGTDTKGYIRLINSNIYDISIDSVLSYFNDDKLGIRNYGEGSYREFFFSFVVTFINNITGTPFATIKILNILILLIYYCSFRKVFEKDNEYISLALLIYVSCYLYFSQFNTLRQSFATALFFSGICWFLQNNKTSYDNALSIFLIVAAAFTHNTVFFALPFLLLSRIKIKEWIIWSVFIIVLICDFFVVDVHFFIENIGYKQLYSNLDSTFIKESGQTFNIYVHYFGFFLRLLFVITFCWLYHYAENDERKFMNIWFGGLVLYILLIRGVNIARFTEHLYSIQILIVPFIFYRLKAENVKIFNKTAIILFSYLICWYVFYLRSNWYGIVPYISIFG